LSVKSTFAAACIHEGEHMLVSPVQARFLACDRALALREVIKGGIPGRAGSVGHAVETGTLEEPRPSINSIS